MIIWIKGNLYQQVFLIGDTISNCEYQRGQSIVTGSDEKQKMLDHVEVKLEFPERLGGDIAKIRWIMLYYDVGESVYDEEYYNKLARYDFFLEYDTELDKYQEVIDRIG